MPKRRAEEYLFCLVTGSIYLFAVNLSIITSTIIQISPRSLFLTGLILLLICMAVFFNRVTMIASGGLLLLAGIFIFLTRENWQEQFDYLGQLLLLARGMLAYQEEYGPVVVKLICMATALPVTMLLYMRFNFYALALGGFAPFIINWIMDYRRDDKAFILFLFCFCLLLVRKMNQNRDGKGQAAFISLLALPVCALTCWFAMFIPGQNAAYTGKSLAQLLDTPLSAVSEFFYLAFNPKYFTFQTTGFTGNNGRLGGPVAVNTREVMKVEASERTYLSGVTQNTYTGHAWTDTLQEGDLYTDGRDAARFEFLETASALMRYASYYTVGGNFMLNYNDWINRLFPTEDQSYIKSHSFPFIMVNLTDTSAIVTYEVDENGETVVVQEDNRIFNMFRPRYGFIYSYLPVDNLRVIVGANRTGSVFHPPKGRDLSYDKPEQDYAQSLLSSAAGDTKSTLLMESETAYSYKYLTADQRLTFMKTILNSARRGFYAETPAQQRAVGPLTPDLFDLLYTAYTDNVYDAVQPPGLFNPLPEQLRQSGENDLEAFINILDAYTADTLTAYADRVYDYYTGLPESLPPRVYDLADSIVKDCTTDYERVKAFEQYLLQFPYTLTPSPVPDDADFVDYFLFEGKEGYCTYYASALAVLSRCVGIPSRYVEGYLLPPAPGTDGLYVVTNKQAHSWAEVYLEGYGWLTVEATAPYHYVAEDQPVAASSGIFTPSFQADPSYEEYLKNFGFDEREIQSQAFARPAASTAASASSPAQTLNPAIIGALRVFIFIAAVVLFCGGVVLIQRMREALRYKKIARLPVNEQAQAYFKGLIKITTYYHYPFRAEETPRMYGNRVGLRFAFKSDSVFLRDLIGLYYKARYGARPLSEKELAMLRDCYYDMIVFLRSVRIKPHFWYLRYVKRVTLL